VGCDAYLLGSMVVFLFMGVSMTSLLLSELHQDHTGAGGPVRSLRSCRTSGTPFHAPCYSLSRSWATQASDGWRRRSGSCAIQIQALGAIHPT
jgi:hypothetical protein